MSLRTWKRKPECVREAKPFRVIVRGSVFWAAILLLLMLPCLFSLLTISRPNPSTVAASDLAEEFQSALDAFQKQYGFPGATAAYLLQDGRFRASGGDSFVTAIEFSSPLRANVLMVYGNASQPGSRHLTDQLPLFPRKELRPVWRTRPEIEAHLESRDAF